MRRLLPVLLASLVFLAAGTKAADLSPYEINTILSMSGPATFVGKGISQSLQTLQSVVNQQGGINGRPLKFVFYDDQSSPQIAVQIVNQLVARNVPLILGPSFSNTCHAVIPLVTNGPVLWCLSGGVVPDKESYSLTVGPSVEDTLRRNLQFLQEHGWARIATLTTTDTTGQDADDSIDKALASPQGKGMLLVAREHFGTTDFSVSAQLARIRAANPQALIAWTTGPPIGTVFQALKTSGYDIPVVTSPGNQSYSLMKQYGTYAPKQLFIGGGIYVTGSYHPENRAALRAFYDAYGALGMKPDQLSGDAWDAGMILVDAIRHLGPAATGAEVHAYIEGLHGFEGIWGTYDFRDGDNRGVGFGNVVSTRWDVDKNTWFLAN